VATITLGGSVLEGQTSIYVFTLTDYAGQAIDKADLAFLTLTYYDLRTEEILNSRLEQDALDQNDVTVLTEIPAGGSDPVTTVTWFLQPEDTQMLDARHGVESHVALFQWAWDVPEQRAALQVRFDIENLTYVP
jgi:hypothetical protein